MWINGKYTSLLILKSNVDASTLLRNKEDFNWEMTDPNMLISSTHNSNGSEFDDIKYRPVLAEQIKDFNWEMTDPNMLISSTHRIREGKLLKTRKEQNYVD